MELVVPPIERDEDLHWPSLGSQVGEWQEASLVFGPGDLLGRSYRLDEEDSAILERAYQVYPPQHTGPCRFDVEGAGWRCLVGNGRCGRRRFDSVVLMLRKGLKKSERAAAIGAAELAEDGPVRCDGFRREGGMWIPVGRPVTSPSIYVFAFGKEQAEDTSFDAMKAMIEKGPGADKFIVWEDRILRSSGRAEDGECKAMASAPDSKDGAKTTFQIKEEPHRWTEPRHHEAHSTTRGNLSKRPIAEPWELFPTTAFAPGEGSVAEELHTAAVKLDRTPDRGREARMFFFYRWADERIPIRDEKGDYDLPGLRRAIVNATGPVAMRWSDPDGIMSLQFLAAGADPNYAERVWLNRRHKGNAQAFDIARWNELADPAHVVPPGALVVLAFHGARYWDAAALIGTEIATGYQWPLDIWERPPDVKEWEVDSDAVDVAVANAFDQLEVWTFYVNPDHWESNSASWQQIYGEKRVFSWKTKAATDMSRAVRTYGNAIRAGEVSHPGDRTALGRAFTAHLGAAQRRQLASARDEQGRPAFVLSKEREDSPHPINAANAGVMGWQARLDALRDGATVQLEWRAV